MTDLIEHHDIFHFDGLSLTPTARGLTRPAGTLPDMDPTATGNVIVKVLDVTWTGDLRIIRGHIKPTDDGYDGGLIFPDETPENTAIIPISTAATLMEQGVWRRYRY
jgi:hypothetical protein